MHMADALLAPAVAATMYVASGTAAGISIHKLKKDDEAKKLPVMAVSAALVFAGQISRSFDLIRPGIGDSLQCAMDVSPDIQGAVFKGLAFI